mgnify:FL=1
MDLKIGEWYSNKQIKDKLQKYYLLNGINKIAKASDINLFYSVKDKQIREFGVQINGKLIISKIK